jgi:ATP-dependent Clp protease ATP-binding subunit ClpC
MIVFIDELHTVVGAGAAEGAMDASNMLKPALARGELHVIGATTIDEYRKNVEKDPALERRFQPVLVREPTVDETIQVLYGLKDRYEAYHRVRITDEAIVHLADRGFDPEFGARPLRRTLQRLVENELSRMLLEGTLQEGDAVEVRVQDGRLLFDVDKQESEHTAEPEPSPQNA